MTIAEALFDVRARIDRAAHAAGRDSGEVRLIAVSKTFPTEAVLAALAAGQRDFGENRVEEALPKIAAVAAASSDAPRWHLIGHLQSRKVRDAGRSFGLIHSVDTLRLAIGQFIVTALLSLAAGMLFERNDLASLSASVVPVLYGGLLSVGVAYTLQVIAQKDTTIGDN